MRSLLMQKKSRKLFFQFYGEMKEFFPENAVEYFAPVAVNGVNSKCNCSQVISREVFCHEYGKIPRHTGQNAITEGDLECILNKLLRTE